MINSKLRLGSVSFDFSKANEEINKMFSDSEKKIYKDFIKNPQNKSFRDLEHFIQFISPTDFAGKSPKHQQVEAVEIDDVVVKCFVLKQQRMNELERQRNNQNFSDEIMSNSLRELERKGKCLTNLGVQAIRGGPNSQFLFYLVDTNPNFEEVRERFKDHPFCIDDEVAFCTNDYSPIVDYYGTVYSILHNGLVIVVPELNPSFSCSVQKFSIVLRQYESAFFINQKTLMKLMSMVSSNLPHASKNLMSNLLRENLRDKENEAVDLSLFDDMTFSDKELNSDQQLAVKAALAAVNIFLIDGPAGTGKTRVLSEIIYQCVQKNLKVLACAPSSIPVDNLIYALSNREIKCCRIGRSGGQDEYIDRFSLDRLTSTNKKNHDYGKRM